jgi:hypothetical protein
MEELREVEGRWAWRACRARSARASDCVWPSARLSADLRRRCFVLVAYGIESTDDEVLPPHQPRPRLCAVEQRASDSWARDSWRPSHSRSAGRRTHEERVARMRAGCRPCRSRQLNASAAAHPAARGGRRNMRARPDDFRLFSADEYVDLVVDYVERERPTSVRALCVAVAASLWRWRLGAQEPRVCRARAPAWSTRHVAGRLYCLRRAADACFSAFA